MDGGVTAPPGNDPAEYATATPRFGGYPTRRRRNAALAVSIACITSMVALASPWFLFIPFVYDNRPMWPGGSSTVTMDGGTPGSGIEVPNCALVTVAWTDLDGRAVGVGAWQGGEAIVGSSCPDTRIPLAAATPPSTCGPDCVPGGISEGPGPMFYQTGRSGSFQFVQTQPGGFGLWAVMNGTSSPSPDPISVHYSYTVPAYSLFLPATPGSAPAVPPLAWALLIPGVAAGWFGSRRVLRRNRRQPPADPDVG